MAADLSGTSPDRQFRELVAESNRLRSEFLEASLALSTTMAGFASAGKTETLRNACATAAARGYATLARVLAKHDGTDQLQPDFEHRVEELRSAISNGLAPDQPSPEQINPPKRQTAHSPSELTHREIDVLRCIVQGQSTKQTAFRLGISFKTAACHRYHAMSKLGVHDTASLVRQAIRSGLADA